MPISHVVVVVGEVCGVNVGYGMAVPVAVTFRSPSGTWRIELDAIDPASPEPLVVCPR